MVHPNKNTKAAANLMIFVLVKRCSLDYLVRNVWFVFDAADESK